MSDFENQITNLKAVTEKNRRAFLETEIETCSIGLERARIELSLDNSMEARKEFSIVSRGIEVIEKFLGEKRVPMPDLEVKLTQLKLDLEALRKDLDKYPA